jgi:hypothetical protein
MHTTNPPKPATEIVILNDAHTTNPPKPANEIVILSDAHSASRRTCGFFLNRKYTVISTEAAHAFVSRAVEKSAFPPRPLPSQCRVFEALNPAPAPLIQ